MAIRDGFIALSLKCLSILLIVTLISATSITTSGSQTSLSSTSPLTDCDSVGICECLVLVLKSQLLINLRFSLLPNWDLLHRI